MRATITAGLVALAGAFALLADAVPVQAQERDRQRTSTRVERPARAQQPTRAATQPRSAARSQEATRARTATRGQTTARAPAATRTRSTARFQDAARARTATRAQSATRTQTVTRPQTVTDSRAQTARVQRPERAGSGGTRGSAVRQRTPQPSADRGRTTRTLRSLPAAPSAQTEDRSAPSSRLRSATGSTRADDRSAASSRLRSATGVAPRAADPGPAERGRSRAWIAERDAPPEWTDRDTRQRTEELRSLRERMLAPDRDGRRTRISPEREEALRALGERSRAQAPAERGDALRSVRERAAAAGRDGTFDRPGSSDGLFGIRNNGWGDRRERLGSALAGSAGTGLAGGAAVSAATASYHRSRIGWNIWIGSAGAGASIWWGPRSRFGPWWHVPVWHGPWWHSPWAFGPAPIWWGHGWWIGFGPVWVVPAHRFRHRHRLFVPFRPATIWVVDPWLFHQPVVVHRVRHVPISTVWVQTWPVATVATVPATPRPDPCAEIVFRTAADTEYVFTVDLPVLGAYTIRELELTLERDLAAGRAVELVARDGLLFRLEPDVVSEFGVFDCR